MSTPLDQLIEMGCSPIISEAAIKTLKTSDLSALLDWVSDHAEEEQKWTQWLAENQSTQQQPNIEGEGQGIDHLINKQICQELQKLGNSKNVSQKALLLTSNASLESAVAWIQEHKYDPDFEEQLKLTGQAFTTSSLTPQEAKQKLKELTEKARENRKKREEEEEREREKNRVKYGKQMIEAKRIGEEQAIKRQAELDAIQKRRDEQYKKKLVEQMRMERNEKLGLKEDIKATNDPVVSKKEIKLSKLQQVEIQCEQVKVGMHAYPDKAKIFFETAQIYVNNIVKNNGEEKFRKINKDNKAFQSRVVECFGGVQTLEVIGYEEDGGFLVMKKVDLEELKHCSQVLQKYISYY